MKQNIKKIGDSKLFRSRLSIKLIGPTKTNCWIKYSCGGSYYYTVPRLSLSRPGPARNIARCKLS